MSVDVTLTNLANLQNETSAVTAINNNSTAIETGFESCVSLSGDTLTGNLDMDSNYILNLPAPVSADSPLRLQDLSDFLAGGTVTNIPAGGTTGQILVKLNNTNYNVGWSSESASLTAGTNIVITGTTPATIATSLTPTFTSVNKVAITAPATSATLTIPDGVTFTGPASSGTAATLARSEALTNKTINGNTFTAGTYTLTGASSKVLTFSNTLTLAGTDGTTLTFQGTDTYVGRATTDTLTNKTLTAPVLTGPVLGTPASGTLTNCTGYPTSALSGLGTGVATFLATPSSANLIAAVTDETGTGSLVFSTTPTLVTPILGVATATTVNKVTITAPASAATLTIPDGVTLTGPASTGTVMTLGNTETVTGVKTFGSAGAVGRLKVAGTTSGSTIIDATAIAGSGTVILPTTGTLATLAGSETFTNKTLTSPILTTPVLGTPSSGTLTSCTGLPISTGLTGVGAGVLTALAVNTGTDGAFVVKSGALGSPSSAGTMPAFTLGSTVTGNSQPINNISQLGIGPGTVDSIFTLNANTVSPPSPISGTVFHLVAADNTPARFVFEGAGPTGGNAVFTGRSTGGTIATPSATPAGTSLFSLTGAGFGTALTTTGSAAITLTANTLWSGTNTDTYITLATTPTGSLVRANALRVQPSGGVSIGATSIAADPGIGQLNVDTAITTALYKSGTAPTSVSGAGPILIGSASTINFRMKVTLNGTDYWIPLSTTAY